MYQIDFNLNISIYKIGNTKKIKIVPTISGNLDEIERKIVVSRY